MTQDLRRRDGFTLVEVLVVSFLTAFLAVLVSACWRGFGQSANDALARCRVAQEMNLAVNTLARDFGGSLDISGGSLDTSGGSLGTTPWESQFLDWDYSIPNTLRLCFDSPFPSNPPDAPNDTPAWLLPQTRTPPQTVISYSLEPTVVGSTPQGPVQLYALVRTVESAVPNTTFTVANYITNMQITPVPGEPTEIQIQLMFSYPIKSPINNPTQRTCTLIVRKPP